MNNELETQLAAILTKTVEAAGEAKEFILAELPDVIQQLLLYNLSMSLGKFTIILLAIIVVAYHTRWSMKQDCKSMKNWYFDKCGNLLPSVLWLILPAIFLPSFLFGNLLWVKIWLAPKVYLIEYTANLIK